MRHKISIYGLKLLHKRKKKILTKILGRNFYIYPDVFDPRYILKHK